jgi:hypothetical protein
MQVLLNRLNTKERKRFERQILRLNELFFKLINAI